MVSLRGIHKSYPMGQDRLKVLKGIDLSMEAGEYRLQDALIKELPASSAAY